MDRLTVRSQLETIIQDLENIPPSNLKRKRIISKSIDKLSELTQGLNEPITEPIEPTNSYGLTEREVFYLAQMWKNAKDIPIHHAIRYLYEESGIGDAPEKQLIHKLKSLKKGYLQQLFSRFQVYWDKHGNGVEGLKILGLMPEN